MTLTQFFELLAVALFIGFLAGLIDLAREARAVAKMGGRAFIKDRQEFLSVWQLAHELEGLAPAPATDTDGASPEVARRINQILHAYFREELPLCKLSGYRVLGHHWSHSLLFMDRLHEKLWSCIATGRFDIQLLDAVYVRRGEFLRFSQVEFIEPPACWLLPALGSPTTKPDEEAQEDNKDGWYESMSDRRKTFVAGLEVARYLWKQDQTRGYKDVFEHPLMRQTGFASVFSLESFKKHAKPFASEAAKSAGRRPNSTT